jgi:peptide/nickel transport system permease protein
MRRWLIAAALRLLAVMVAASLAGALLLRYAPGFSSDQQELNTGLSAQSLQAIRQAHLAESNLPRFYVHYLGSLMRGDLGRSLSLNQPVGELLRERLPLTARNIGLALLLAWLLGVAMAVASAISRSSFFVALSEGVNGVFISTPAAALALVFVVLRFPPFAAAALLTLPKIYRYSSNLLREGYEAPHVLMARAKGVGPWRLLAWHVAPVALPQWIALMGISMSVAIGVLLPIEVISDVPGIGQLAWQAAESRDLTLLVNLTLIVTFLTVCANSISDGARRSFIRSAA